MTGDGERWTGFQTKECIVAAGIAVVVPGPWRSSVLAWPGLAWPGMTCEGRVSLHRESKGRSVVLYPNLSARLVLASALGVGFGCRC